jgi:Carboxypeptidase regulatory-like domain
MIQPQSFASIAGTIRDTNGAAVRDARVMLVGRDNAAGRVVMADSKGAFAFGDLPPGSYHVEINAAGLMPSVSEEVVLGSGEGHKLSMAVTRLPTTTTTVPVVATLNEVAQAQVKQEEKQRILGILPNFYTSYIWDAARNIGAART